MKAQLFSRMIATGVLLAMTTTTVVSQQPPAPDASAAMMARRLRTWNRNLRAKAVAELKKQNPELIRQAVAIVAADSKSTTNGKRRLAATVLGELGVHAGPAINVLTAMTKDADKYVAAAAKAALAKVKAAGTAAPTGGEGVVARTKVRPAIQAVPVDFGTPNEAAAKIIEALLTGTVEERRKAADTAKSLKADAIPAIPALIAALNDEDTATRRHAESALLNLAPRHAIVVTALSNVLAGQDNNLRRNACRMLSKCPPLTKEVLAGLLYCIGEEDTYLSRQAAATFLGMGSRLQPHHPMLIERLNGGKTTSAAQVAIITHFRTHARTDADMLKALTTALSDSDPAVVAKAAGAIERVWTDVSRASRPGEPVKFDADAVIPALLTAMKNPGAKARSAAAAAAARMGGGNRKVREALGAMTTDNDSKVRLQAMTELCSIRPITKECVAALVAALVGKDPSISRRAAPVLAKAGPGLWPFRATLLAEMDNSRKSPIARRALIEGLGGMGQVDAEIATALAEAIGDRDANTAKSAGYALGKFREKLWPHRAPVMAMLAKRGLRSSARMPLIAALGRMGRSDDDLTAAMARLTRDKDSSVAIAAVEAIAGFGKGAAAALPALAALARNPDIDVRRIAIQSFGKIGVADKRVVQVLVGAIRDREPLVTIAACHSLSQLGTDCATALPSLNVIAKDASKHILVRMAAIGAMGGIGVADEKTIETLRDILLSDDFVPPPPPKNVKQPRRVPPVRNWVARQSPMHGWTPRWPSNTRQPTLSLAVPSASGNQLGAPLSLCACAADALAAIGPGAIAAAPDLRKRLTCRGASLVAHCARALGQLGPEAEVAVEDLIVLLGHKDPNVCVGAAAGLGGLGVWARVAMKDLTHLLSSKHSMAKTAAGKARRDINEATKAYEISNPGESTVPTDPERVWRQLNSVLKATRGKGAAGLATLPNEAKGKIILDLQTKLASDNVNHICQAMMALAGIGGAADPAIPAIAERLQHEDIEVAITAAESLRDLGLHTQPVTAQLAEALSHKDMRVKSATAETLMAIGAGAETAIPALRKILIHVRPVYKPDVLAEASPEEELVLAAIETFRRLGPKARPAAADLGTLLVGRHPGLARAAAKALLKMKEGAIDILPVLVKAVRTGDNFVAYTSGNVIAHLGPAAESAIPQLEPLTKHKNAFVSDAAKAALRGIRGK